MSLQPPTVRVCKYAAVLGLSSHVAAGGSCDCELGDSQEEHGLKGCAQVVPPRVLFECKGSTGWLVSWLGRDCVQRSPLVPVHSFLATF